MASGSVSASASAVCGGGQEGYPVFNNAGLAGVAGLVGVINKPVLILRTLNSAIQNKWIR